MDSPPVSEYSMRLLPFPGVRSGACPSPGCSNTLGPELLGTRSLSELRTGSGGLALGAPRQATVGRVPAGARDAATLAVRRKRPEAGAPARPREEARKGSAAGPDPSSGLQEEEGEEEEVREGGRAGPPGKGAGGGGGGRPGREGGSQ